MDHEETGAVTEVAERPLTERARRRPEYRGGAPVVLLDGETWFLPRPRVRFGVADADGYTVFLTMPEVDGYDALYERFQEAESDHEFVAASLALAKSLITANYDLSTDEVNEVLQFSWDPEDAEAFRVRKEVTAIALGNGPKAEDGTDALSSLNEALSRFDPTTSSSRT
jgi:hypothetical protein